MLEQHAHLATHQIEFAQGHGADFFTVDLHAAALRAQGNQASVVRYDGLGHATLIGAMSRPLRWLAPVLDDVTAFINGPPGG